MDLTKKTPPRSLYSKRHHYKDFIETKRQGRDRQHDNHRIKQPKACPFLPKTKKFGYFNNCWRGAQPSVYFSFFSVFVTSTTSKIYMDFLFFLFVLGGLGLAISNREGDTYEEGGN